MLLSIPEISTPAPLQTEDGPAVATMDTMVVLFGSFWSAPLPQWNFLFLFFIFYYYLCKDDQSTPSKHLTSTKASNSTSNETKTGTGPATPARFYKLKQPFSSSATSYICEQKEKNGKKKERKAYIYTFVQKRHEPRHYWCSVYTQTRCRESSEHVFELHPPQTTTDGRGRSFLYINKNIHKKASFHNTTCSGSTEGLWKSYITSINFRLINQFPLNCFFIILFPLCLIWIPDDCQLWIDFFFVCSNLCSICWYCT